MVANERGQLLLIGGVAIAIVVFSTILFPTVSLSLRHTTTGSTVSMTVRLTGTSENVI